MARVPLLHEDDPDIPADARAVLQERLAGSGRVTSITRVEPTHALSQAVAKGERGPIELTREEYLPPELALVDRGIEAMGELVALEPLGAILLGDDVGTLAGLQECAQAAGMVDVAVGVDSGVQR